MTPTALLILTIISATLLFGFTILCVCKFGLLTCYSAYGPAWAKITKFNPWVLVTLLSAFILMPVTLQMSAGKAWQFTGFLCCAFLMFVAMTPDYDKNKFALTIHLIGAEGCGLWSVLYVIFNATHLWWIMLIYLALCGIAILITGKKYWNFWLEEAAFLSYFTVIFIIVISAL